MRRVADSVSSLAGSIPISYLSERRTGDLFARTVATGGALLSEQPDGARGWKANFPRRNRIISGLSDAVVVVRAERRSGALVTADWAASQGVPLLAVPGDAAQRPLWRPFASGALICTWRSATRG